MYLQYKLDFKVIIHWRDSMGYIYKISNSQNQKVYIGQTIQEISKRFYNHIYCAYNKDNMKDYPLYRAIRKYGKENFFIQIIEEVEDEQLNNREIYWIDYYNSYVPKGYNCTLGGSGVRKYTKAQKEEMLKYFLTEGEKNYSKTQKKFGCSFETLYNYINPKGYFSSRKTNSFECVLLHKITKEVLKFPSVYEASEKLGVSNVTIYSCISERKNSTKTIKDYFCGCSLEECYDKYNEYYSNHPKVVCVGTNEIFPSVRKASEWLIENNKTTVKIPQQLDANIRRAIKNKIRAYGYHWKYYLGDDNNNGEQQ